MEVLDIIGKIFKLIFLYIIILCSKKQKNKILLLPEFTKSGGCRTYFFYILEYFYNNKFKVIVLLNEKDIDLEISDILQKYQFEIELIYFKYKDFKFENFFFSALNIRPLKYLYVETKYFLNLIKKIKPSTLFLSLRNTEGYISVMLLPIKVIYMIHSVPWNKQDRIKKLILNAFLSHNKLILTVSNYSKQIILQNWLEKKTCEHVVYIYNYYEPKETSKNTVNDNNIRILTLGNVVDYKNPYFWLEVAKNISNKYGVKVEFIWAGEGDLLEEFIEKTKHTKSIKFIGYSERVDYLYSITDIYFQPSLAENHSISVVGAMCYQIPCVVSNYQGLPETIVDCKSGFVVDVSTINEAVERFSLLIENTERRIQMGKYGRLIYEQKYTKEQWQTGLNNLFS